MKVFPSPLSLLTELLLIVVLAEVSVMFIVPVLAPIATAAYSAFVDVGMVLMLCASLIYMRLTKSFHDAGKAIVLHQQLAGISPSLFLLVGILTTSAGVWWESKRLDGIENSSFNQGTDRTQAELVRRFNQSLFGLKGSRGEIAANPQSKRLQFRAYVQSCDLQVEFSGIRGFCFIARAKNEYL